MNSPLFRLHIEDLIKGATLAVIVVVLGSIQQAVTTHGFDVMSYDWATIGQLAITSFVAYLTKNLLSDQNGAVLGTIGGTK